MSTQQIGIRISATGAAQVRSELDQAASGMDRLGEASAGVERTLGSLRGVFAGLVGAVTVRELVSAADAITNLNSQLRLATGSAQQAGQAYGQLFDIAQRSRVSFVELGGTFASIARATEGLGISQSRLLDVTEAIGNAITLSGASAGASQAALVQLSQGLAAGTLRGEELNSVMEQTPRLARALADGLGVTIGQLRQLGQEGKITAQAVLGALESQGEVLRSELAGSALTVGGALTLLGNSARRFVGDFDQATDASGTLASAIKGVSGALDTLGSVVREHGTAIAALTGALAGGAMLAALPAMASGVSLLAGAVGTLGAVLVANPLVAALLGVGVAVGGIAAYSSARSRTAEGMASELRSLEQSLRAMERSPYAGTDAVKKQIDERREAIFKLRLELEKASGAGRSTMAGGRDPVELARERRIGQLMDQYAPQADRVEAQIAAIRAELGGVIPADLEARIRASLEKPVKDGRAEVSQYTREMIAQGEATERWKKEWEAAQREAEKAMAAAVREREQYLATLDRAAASAAGDTQRLEDEVVLITQGKAALEERIQARMMDQALALESAAQWSAASEGEAEALRARARELREQIRLRQQIAQATDDKDVAAANQRAADQANAEWQRTADQIEQALVNALMEGGKSGAELIKGVFRTLVLKPTIEAIVRPFARDIAGVARAFLGLDGGTSDPEMAKLRRQAGKSEQPSMWTEFGEWSAKGFERAGDKLAERGFKDIGNFLKDNNQTLGKVSQTLGEVGNYFQAFKAAEDGRWGEAIGQAVGTAIGGPMGGQIGQQIGSFVDRIFRGGAGTPHRGSIVRTMADGTQSLARDADWASILNNYDQGTDQGLRTLAGIATGGFNRFASAFGQQGTAQSVISFAADGRDASIGNFQLTRDGRSLVNLGGTDFARYSSDGAQAFQAFGLDVLKQTRAALDTLDLSQWARDELKKFDDQIATLGEGNLERATDLFNNTVEGIARLQAGMVELQRFMEPLGGVFLKVSDLSGDAMKQLVDFAGGLENLANQTQTYVQQFFNREEIAGLQAREVRDTLLSAGLTQNQLRGLDTRQEFRALVESIDPSTEAGRKQLAALLGVSGTFAGLSDYFATDGGDLLSAAGQAPNTGPLTAPGAAPTAQAAESPAVAVLTNINAGIDKVVATLRELIDINKVTPRVAVSVPGGSEVTMDWNAGS